MFCSLSLLYLVILLALLMVGILLCLHCTFCLFCTSFAYPAHFAYPVHFVHPAHFTRPVHFAHAAAYCDHTSHFASPARLAHLPILHIQLITYSAHSSHCAHHVHCAHFAHPARFAHPFIQHILRILLILHVLIFSSCLANFHLIFSHFFFLLLPSSTMVLSQQFRLKKLSNTIIRSLN